MYFAGVIEDNVQEILTENLWRRNLEHAGEDLLEDLMHILSRYHD